MDEQKQYPHNQEPAVRAAWTEGMHPDQCRGNCQVMNCAGISVCYSCGWDDQSEIK